MNWQRAPLGEICSLITDGKHGDCKNEVNSGYYFISCKDVKDGRIHYKNARQIEYDGFLETHRRTDLMPGDLLLTNSGTIGRLAIARDDEKTPSTTFQKSVAVLKPIREKIESEFLYYSLQANKKKLINAAGGAAQKNLLLGALRKFPIEVPSLQQQILISSILSPFDELIDNNRRRIELLDESARQLYKEWFVRFRFPGHEHVKIIDGVPEGWEEKTLFECVDVLSGGTPKTKEPEFWDGDIPFFTPKDTGKGPYTYHTEKMITEAGLTKCNSKLYEKDTLFITARGTVGKLRLAQRPMAMNQSCYALMSKTFLTQNYLYFAVTERVNHLKSRAGGAVFDAIVVDTFKKIPFFLPNETLAHEFSEFAKDNLKQIDLLSSQNRQLVEARDLLLPKLISGKIAV